MGWWTLEAVATLSDIPNKGELDVFKATEAIAMATMTSAPAIVIRRYEWVEFEGLSQRRIFIVFGIRN